MHQPFSLPVCFRTPGSYPGNELFPRRSVLSASPWEGRPLPWRNRRVPLLLAAYKHIGQHLNKKIIVALKNESLGAIIENVRVAARELERI